MLHAQTTLARCVCARLVQVSSANEKGPDTALAVVGTAQSRAVLADPWSSGMADRGIEQEVQSSHMLEYATSASSESQPLSTSVLSNFVCFT